MTAVADPLTETIAAYSARPNVYAARRANSGADLFRRFEETLRRGVLVLDAGCGPGRDLARFVAAGHAAIGVDLCPEFATMASRHGPVVVADVRALLFPDATFDAVWACASLVHLDDDGVAAALAELGRVTRADGRLLVSVKGDGVPGWRTCAVGRRWFNVWTVERLAGVACGAGLTVERVEQGPVWVDLWAQQPDGR